MKIQCELCREIVPIGAFRVAGDGIEVTCAACGESFFVAADGASDAPRAKAAAAATEPAQADAGENQMRCPKCDLEQPIGTACRTCGLRADLFEDYAREHAEDAPPELEAMWESCEADWHDEEAHGRFTECAAAAFAYAYAARRYRSVLRQRADDEIAHRQLDRLSRMAEVTLTSSAAARRQAGGDEQPYKNVIVLLMVIVLLAGIGGMYMLLRQARDIGSETRQTVPATTPADKRSTSPAPAGKRPVPATPAGKR